MTCGSVGGEHFCVLALRNSAAARSPDARVATQDTKRGVPVV
jgi:hypothetical protein